MRSLFLLAAAAGALALAGQSLAATPSDRSTSSAPDTTSAPADTQSTPSSGAATAASPGASTSAGASTSTSTSAALTVGQPVKDNTGVTIGSIADLKSDASGQKTAVIQMGAQKFQVAANNLGVANGAAVINLTQAQIAGMLQGKSTTP